MLTCSFIQDKDAAIDAAKSDVVLFAVKSITDVFDGNDPRIGAALEIVNELVYIPDVKPILESKKDNFRQIIDLLLTKMLDLFSANKLIKEDRDAGGIGTHSLMLTHSCLLTPAYLLMLAHSLTHSLTY